MNNPVKHHLTIDRFEDEWAVVEIDSNHTFNLPRYILPEHACEGDVLNMNIRIDHDETKKRKEKITLLANDLFIEE